MAVSLARDVGTLAWPSPFDKKKSKNIISLTFYRVKKLVCHIFLYVRILKRIIEIWRNKETILSWLTGGHCLKVKIALSLILLLMSNVLSISHPSDLNFPMMNPIMCRDWTVSWPWAHQGFPLSLNSCVSWSVLKES